MLVYHVVLWLVGTLVGAFVYSDGFESDGGVFFVVCILSVPFLFGEIGGWMSEIFALVVSLLLTPVWILFILRTSSESRLSHRVSMIVHVVVLALSLWAVSDELGTVFSTIYR